MVISKISIKSVNAIGGLTPQTPPSEVFASELEHWGLSWWLSNCNIQKNPKKFSTLFLGDLRKSYLLCSPIFNKAA